ncbi:MAG: iron-sulfur cluster assembly scaffold protein [Kiritimatiellae bacterium]|nr:iron-sulfur cluster assembly scaffold protein [Kiritimatiellia bacterium]
MAWEYSEKTKQLFMDAVHGKPGTHLGEVENPDGLGEHGSIVCGDALRFTFRVQRHEDPLRDVIVEARYLTFGCTSAIAASEALCSILEQRRCTPIEALKITNQDIVNYLEGLPAQKIHCSVMGAEALESAVFNWANKRGVDLDAAGVKLKMTDDEEGRIVCKCFSVSEPYLRSKIRELNLHTIAEITGALKAGGACMQCHHAPGGLQDILNDVWNGAPAPADAAFEAPEPEEALHSAPAAETREENESPFQFMRRIETMVDRDIRPLLHRDGGDLELVDIKGFQVYCRLMGACAGCPGAASTLKYMVEQMLKDRVDERIRVIAV